MDNDRVQADIVQQNDVPDEVGFQFLVFHGVAAVFDDHGLVGEPLDVG